MSRWSSLMTDTVYYATESSLDSRGSVTYGATTSTTARVEASTETVTGADGLQRQATHRIFSESEIPLRARVWVPGDDSTDATKARYPIRTGKASFPDGSDTAYETYL